MSSGRTGPPRCITWHWIIVPNFLFLCLVPLSCLPPSIREIYTMTPLVGLDHVATVTTGMSVGHDATEASDVFVCWLALYCCDPLHERNVHLQATGHTSMLKTYKGGKSVVRIISH